MKNFYIVGCGGVASYFLPSFIKTLKHHKAFKKSCVTLVDGDDLEEKNLARQLFDGNMVGANKAAALAAKYITDFQIAVEPTYFVDTTPVETGSMIIGFVDNHPARKDMLHVADASKSQVIFAANSTIGANALYYNSEWSGKTLDPRVRYPEIVTTEEGSPVRPAGCDTEARLSEVPQTAIANQFAAAHALLLWNFWVLENKNLDPEETFKYWPVEIWNTFSQTKTLTVDNILNP